MPTPSEPCPIPVRPDQEQIADEDLDFAQWCEFDRMVQRLMSPYQIHILSSRLMTYQFTLQHLQWVALKLEQEVPS